MPRFFGPGSLFSQLSARTADMEREAIEPSAAELRAISERIRAMTPEGSQFDSVALIREDRDR